MTDQPKHRALLARLEAERAHHESCTALSSVEEAGIAHSGMAAGLHIAAIRVVEEFEGPEAARKYMQRTTPEPGMTLAGTPHADLYFCPTAEEVESAAHGGFDQCCGQTELHVPLPDVPGTHALSELLSRRRRETYTARKQTDTGLREQYAAAIDRLRDSGGVYSLEDHERDRIAETVLAIRDQRMEQLATRIAELEKQVAEAAEDYAQLENHTDATCEAVQRRDAAEAALARVREYLETSDDDGIRTRETVLRFLEAAEQAAREAS
ncbi:hypothetical protein TPA0910_87170 [Streptomyces hygroscopicus subsp. sporocinereus]|uniref:Uncharacterized protein n=1 Tax=Streptomyces hygroscopicus TaxID=1912 RepID=A0ABQ3UFA3_STRHY|nr:hypothetical protein [Streptomyces hygroscopicus]GHJ34284.1 hypothetical protein TPA0910_87170 [Streptomyces hygroscopicus]